MYYNNNLEEEEEKVQDFFNVNTSYQDDQLRHEYLYQSYQNTLLNEQTDNNTNNNTPTKELAEPVGADIIHSLDDSIEQYIKINETTDDSIFKHINNENDKEENEKYQYEHEDEEEEDEDEDDSLIYSSSSSSGDYSHNNSCIYNSSINDNDSFVNNNDSNNSNSKSGGSSSSCSYSIDYDSDDFRGMNNSINTHMASLNDLYQQQQQRINQHQQRQAQRIPFFRSVYGQLFIVITLAILMQLLKTDDFNHRHHHHTSHHNNFQSNAQSNDNSIPTQFQPKDDRLLKMINQYVYFNKLGDRPTTLSILYDILKLSPYDCGASMRIAQLLLEDDGRNITTVNKAESMFIRALDCERWLKIDYITEFVDFYLSLNRFQEAAALLTRSSTMFPDDMNFKIQLQRLRSKLNLQIEPSPNGYCFSGLD
ncbi:hypothetical protein PPL_01732 [Heterostelium album PN500]|uniref:Uncharacterized protein n=1 Tax=Heterostelium pallidum (strain ATCC 26659 / Pp 5 / PN500) TaxID=670386 RepID=D3B0B6_HETP5|nr:hypothetical protein PPL_01732 [Heterostelium album PN500]EFA84740.1 hypothetical protein PPL_01732 [Heterostelium album PN500]|eukprot:XP_020436852.1 hypothetical protein PPL_01732 [Heterostelium album PN500]